MPFQSEKQRKYLWANEPEIAREWTDKYGSGIAKALGGRIPFANGSNWTNQGNWTNPGQYKQDMLNQYSGIMNQYLPEGRANMTSSPIFQRGFEAWNPYGIGSGISRGILPVSGKLGLALNLPGSSGMYLDPKEKFIERAGGKVGEGELDWAETFGHELGHLGWQYEPKKIGSVFGKDINIPGEFGALSPRGKGGEEKWNYLHDLMYGSGALMKEKDKRHDEFMNAVDQYKRGEITQEQARKFKDKYDQMPKWGSTSVSHLEGHTDPGETAITGKLVNPGDWSYTPQAYEDIANSGLISEHKKALGFGVNPHEDTMMGQMRTYPNKLSDEAWLAEADKRHLTASNPNVMKDFRYSTDKDEDDPYIDPRRIPGRIQKSVPRKMGMLERFRNRFYKPATSAAGGYNVSQLNKMNALGGYYSEPARDARRMDARRTNILNRAAKGKAVGNVNQLLGKYGYSGTPGSGTLQFTGQHEGSSTAGAGYSRSDSGWSSSPFRRGGLASLWPR